MTDKTHDFFVYADGKVYTGAHTNATAKKIAVYQTAKKGKPFVVVAKIKK